MQKSVPVGCVRSYFRLREATPALQSQLAAKRCHRNQAQHLAVWLNAVIQRNAASNRFAREVVEVLPEILAEAGEAEFFESVPDSYSGAMVAAGHLDQDSAQRWSAAHLDASERGTFFGSYNFMTYVVT